MIHIERMECRRYLAMYLMWFVAWAAVTAIGILLTPHPDGHGTHRQLGLPPCPSVLLFQRPCPGCGLTTSWTQLLHGNLDASLRANPFGPLLYLAFTVGAFVSVWAWAGKRYLVYHRSFNIALGGFVAVFLAASIWRFLDPPPEYSRNPLAPYVSAPPPPNS